MQFPDETACRNCSNMRPGAKTKISHKNGAHHYISLDIIANKNLAHRYRLHDYVRVYSVQALHYRSQAVFGILTGSSYIVAYVHYQTPILGCVLLVRCLFCLPIIVQETSVQCWEKKSMQFMDRHEIFIIPCQRSGRKKNNNSSSFYGQKIKRAEFLRFSLFVVHKIRVFFFF